MAARLIPIVSLAALLFAVPVRGQTPWIAKHGAPEQVLVQWTDEYASEKNRFRIFYINGFDSGGAPRFNAVMVKDPISHYWKYYIDQSHDEFLKRRKELRAEGYRQISLSGYLKDGAPAFAGVWVKDGILPREIMELNLSEQEYRDKIARHGKNKFLPAQVTGYADGAGSYRFAALFVPRGTAGWYHRLDETEPQYQQAIRDAEMKREYRPISVTVYPTPAGLRFAAVFMTDRKPWVARHGMSFEQYQAEFERLTKEGYRPISIAGYGDDNRGGLELFDRAMKKFMAERSIKAGTLAVSRGGKLLLSKGYGTAQANDPFRIASVTKPITAAAVRNLIRENKLSLDTKVIPLLGLKPPPGQTPDPRLNAITIEQVLDHQGGWDAGRSIDPMFRSREIAAALKTPAPAGPVDIIRHMMGQPLQFEPGSRKCYSNFGYCVLGRVIEKVSGKSYVASIKDMLAPLGIRSVELGRTLPRFRNPREPAYLDPGKGRNVVDPESKEDVPAPDGTFYLEAMDAHGGLIASAPDLVRFLEAYWVSGEKRSGNGYGYTFFGSLPGTFTMVMQRPNGMNVVALFNQRIDPSGLEYNRIEEVMRDAADRQSVGGVRYAAVWVKEK